MFGQNCRCYTVQQRTGLWSENEATVLIDCSLCSMSGIPNSHSYSILSQMGAQCTANQQNKRKSNCSFYKTRNRFATELSLIRLLWNLSQQSSSTIWNQLLPLSKNHINFSTQQRVHSSQYS